MVLEVLPPQSRHPTTSVIFKITYQIVWRDVFILMVVDDVVFVFADNVHSTQHVKSVVNAPLHVFEVNLLAHLNC